MALPDLTTAQLLGWILAALFLQASVGIGVALWRRPRAAMSAEPAAPPTVMSTSSAAWPGTREFRVISRTCEDAARSQCSFTLQPVDGQPLPDFRPGQFLTFVLELKDDPRHGVRRSVTRCYSLSDAPAPDHYRVSIKRVPPPADRPDLAPGAASNHFHDHVQVGDVLQVKAPSGHFHIDPDPSVPAVLVAGGIALWAGGSLRPAGGPVKAFDATAVRFEPGRRWASPVSQTRYPVQWQVGTPAGRHTVRALMDAQQLGSRGSTGAIYWEGLAELLDTEGRRVGLGYLEMTVYAGRLQLG